MSLLDLYKKNNQDAKWFKKYFSLGKNKSGKMFGYINTNFRTQEAFISQFKEFEKIEGASQKDRDINVDKHRVVNMLESKLFFRNFIGNDNKEYAYTKTAKGEMYEKFIASTYIPAEEKWLLNYTFLLNGHYSKIPNNIYEKVIFLVNNMANIGLQSDRLKEFARVSLEAETLEELLRKDFFYIMSFYTDPDFIKTYLESSAEEKNKLFDYVDNNRASKNYDACVISKKFKSGGNSNFPQAFDEFKVFNQTLILIERKGENIDDIINSFLLKTEYTDINTFFDSNVEARDIIGIILSDFFDIKKNVAESADDTAGEEIKPQESITESADNIIEEETEPQDYIDDTYSVGRKRCQKLFAKKKDKVKAISNHTCILQGINNCSYFTARANEENYVEVHHIIPQEFRHEFKNSIEVLPNYATLCPRCHSLIHKAIDSERRASIKYLYNTRKDKLKKLNLGVEEKRFLEFYKIDDD